MTNKDDPSAPEAIRAGEADTWENLATDLFNLVLGNFEWVRASGGRHYVCPLCHAVSEEFHGPGHTDDCPRFELARRFDACRLSSRTPLHESRSPDGDGPARQCSGPNGRMGTVLTDEPLDPRAGSEPADSHSSSRTPPERDTPCVWVEDSDGVWDTDCGVTWVFNDGSPAENRTKFCHHCGHPVKPQTYIETLDAEDEDALIPPAPASTGEK